MTTRWQEQLEAVKQELERQNEAWARTKEALAQLGDVRFAVPAEVIEQLQAPVEVSNPPLPIVVGIRA